MTDPRALSRQHIAIKDPPRLYVEPVGFGGERLAIVAEDAKGNRLTIVASRERFADALMARGLKGPMSKAEQATAMFIRDELDVGVLEQVIERELLR